MPPTSPPQMDDTVVWCRVCKIKPWLHRLGLTYIAWMKAWTGQRAPIRRAPAAPSATRALPAARAGCARLRWQSSYRTRRCCGIRAPARARPDSLLRPCACKARASLLAIFAASTREPRVAVSALLDVHLVQAPPYSSTASALRSRHSHHAMVGPGYDVLDVPTLDRAHKGRQRLCRGCT